MNALIKEAARIMLGPYAALLRSKHEIYKNQEQVVHVINAFRAQYSTSSLLKNAR